MGSGTTIKFNYNTKYVCSLIKQCLAKMYEQMFGKNPRNNVCVQVQRYSAFWDWKNITTRGAPDKTNDNWEPGGVTDKSLFI